MVEFSESKNSIPIFSSFMSFDTIVDGVLRGLFTAVVVVIKLRGGFGMGFFRDPDPEISAIFKTLEAG